MSDLHTRRFYEEVMTHLEEIEALMEDYEINTDVMDFDDEDETKRAAQDDLVRFVNHIRDAKTIAESF
jgi:hypothetical protein